MNSKITDALTTIQRATSTLGNMPRSYESTVQVIKADRSRSESYKRDQIAAEARLLADSMIPIVQKLFGRVVTDNRRQTLDPNAVVWQALGAAEAALEAARQLTQDRATVKPEAFELANQRARLIIQTARTPDDFWARYETTDANTQAVLREFGSSLMAQTGEQWIGVRGKLIAMHKARLDSPEVRAAQADFDEVQRAVDAAYAALEGILASPLGLYAKSARETYFGIERRVRTFSDAITGELMAALSFARAEWGWDGTGYSGAPGRAAELISGQR